MRQPFAKMAEGVARAACYFTASLGLGGTRLIHAADLRRRPVVDVEDAEKIGETQEVVVNPGSARVAGIAVSSGVSFIGGQKQLLIPASSVYAIGPDAIMVRRPPSGDDAPPYLAALPRVSDLAGRRVVTDTGKLIGSISDVLFDSQDGRIIGYEFKPPNASSGLDALLGVARGRPLRYVRAESNLRIGAHLMVVPDDAVVDSAETDAEETPAVAGHWQDIAEDDEPTRELFLEEERKAS